MFVSVCICLWVCLCVFGEREVLDGQAANMTLLIPLLEQLALQACHFSCKAGHTFCLSIPLDLATECSPFDNDDNDDNDGNEDNDSSDRSSKCFCKHCGCLWVCRRKNYETNRTDRFLFTAAILQSSVYTIMLTSSCDKQEGSETLYLLVVGRA